MQKHSKTINRTLLCLAVRDFVWLEKAQGGALEAFEQIKQLPYEEALKEVELFCVEREQLRGFGEDLQSHEGGRDDSYTAAIHQKP